MGAAPMDVVETLSEQPRVVFGVGAERCAAQLLVELGAHRVLLVAQARHPDGAERIASALGSRSAGIFLTDQPQVPIDVAERATARALETGADWVAAHGGGTPIGIAKAVALERDVKIAAVPTTYAGSERTDVFGLVRNGQKVTGRSPRVLPALVVYDPSLTVGLHRELSLESLFNALAHSLEAMYAADATLDAREAAVESLQAIVDGLRYVGRDPSDLAGRATALRGAALASAALGGASMGLHHKLAHMLGGSFETPHALTHGILLPYTFWFNAPAVPSVRAEVGRALGTDDPSGFLFDLRARLGLPTSLAALGITAGQLESIADALGHGRYENPRLFSREDIVAMLRIALAGDRPSLAT